MNDEIFSAYICVSFEEGPRGRPLFFQKQINHVFPLWSGMWTRRYLWTPQSRQNIWWVGDARSYRWIFSEKYFEGSFTEEVTGSVNDIFEGGLKFAASEASKKFDNPYSSDREEIYEQPGSDF